MLQFLVSASLLLVCLTGWYVIIRGRWDKMGLKYAGVALATITSTWLFVALLCAGNVVWCQDEELLCMSTFISYIGRNMGLWFFILATGRDAIRFNQHDRRGISHVVTNGGRHQESKGSARAARH